MAVLLDNFIQASAQIEDEERETAHREQKEAARVSQPLDPLLERLSRDYVDDEDLSRRLVELFQVVQLATREMRRVGPVNHSLWPPKRGAIPPRCGF